MDTIQNLMLNWTVLLSLFLTIYVTLAVIHSGAPAYRPIDQNEQQLAFATRAKIPSMRYGAIWLALRGQTTWRLRLAFGEACMSPSASPSSCACSCAVRA